MPTCVWLDELVIERVFQKAVCELLDERYLCMRMLGKFIYLSTSTAYVTLRTQSDDCDKNLEHNEQEDSQINKYKRARS